MLKITLGEMLKRFRIEKGLDAKLICKGLCSPAMMTHFEKGRKVPDILLFEYLLERMGVSPELFSVMVSKELYEYFEWKILVCDAIENEQWDEIERLLAVQSSAQKKSEHKIEVQFYLYTNAICEGIKGNYIQATEMLKEAAQQTILNTQEINEEKVLLSALEIHIMILYMYYGFQGKVLSIKEAEVLFTTLERYIYNGKMDTSQKAKVYSKLISVGLPILHASISDERQMELCKTAFELLCSGKKFHNIVELFELYVPLLEKYNCPEKDFYIKQQEVFRDICGVKNAEDVARPEQFVNSKSKYYIINEFLYSKRKEQGLTQEEVIENICEPETYSRVENGKRAPSRKNMQALAERLDMNWCYYRGEIDTDDLEVFELRRSQRLANIDGDRQLCLSILSKMEERLDMTSVINMQYIKGNQCITEWRLGILSDEEAYNKMINLFRLTQKGNVDTSQIVYYSQTEIEMVAYMAQILRKMNQPKKGIDMIQTILKQVQNSRITITCQWNGFSFALRVLSALYFDIEEYEMVVKISEYVKMEEVKRREGASLPLIFDAIADGFEHISAQYSKDYKKLYRYTYYVADFFSIKKVLKPSKKFYEEHFGEAIKWY